MKNKNKLYKQQFTRKFSNYKFALKYKTNEELKLNCCIKKQNNKMNLKNKLII